MSIRLVRALRRLNTILGLVGVVSIIGVERRARRLVAHGRLAVRRGAGVSVSLVVVALALVVAALVVSRLEVVHLVAIVGLVVARGACVGAQPTGSVQGLDAASAIPSRDASGCDDD